MALVIDGKVPEVPSVNVLSLAQGKLSYRERGDGEILIFLHGLLGSSKAWVFQLQDFSDQYRTVAWDAPGYGESDLIAVSIDAYVDALHQFIERLADKPVNIVGHSMGGSVAMRFAALYPQKVRRLVLSCTHPGYGDPETSPMSEKFENRMRELQEIGPQEYGRRRAKDLLPFEGIPAFVLDHAAEVASETNPEGLRRATRMLQLADNRNLLSRLEMPVLILTGEKDAVVQPRLKAELLALIPAAGHIEMPGLAHAPYFQAPEYYDSLIRDFLSAS